MRVCKRGHKLQTQCSHLLLNSVLSATTVLPVTYSLNCAWRSRGPLAMGCMAFRILQTASKPVTSTLKRGMTCTRQISRKSTHLRRRASSSAPLAFIHTMRMFGVVSERNSVSLPVSHARIIQPTAESFKAVASAPPVEIE